MDKRISLSVRPADQELDYVAEQENYEDEHGAVQAWDPELDAECGVQQRDGDQVLVFHAEPKAFLTPAWRRRWVTGLCRLGWNAPREVPALQRELWAQTSFCGRFFDWEEPSPRYLASYLGVWLCIVLSCLLPAYFLLEELIQYWGPTAWLYHWRTQEYVLFGLSVLAYMLPVLWGLARTRALCYRVNGLSWGGVPIRMQPKGRGGVAFSMLAGGILVVVAALGIWFLLAIPVFVLSIEFEGPFGVWTLSLGLILFWFGSSLYHLVMDEFLMPSFSIGGVPPSFQVFGKVKPYFKALAEPMLVGGGIACALLVAFWPSYEYTRLAIPLFLGVLLLVGLPTLAVIEARLFNLRFSGLTVQGRVVMANLRWQDVLRIKFFGGAAAAWSFGYTQPVFAASWHRVRCRALRFPGKVDVRPFAEILRQSRDTRS